MKNLTNNCIFSGIQEESISNIIECFALEQKKFSEKEIICSYNKEYQQLGLIVSGAVSVNRIRLDGSFDMLEYIEENGLFGAFFGHSDDMSENIVICEKKCVIVFMDKSQITKRCSNSCMHHSMLIENLLSVMSDKIMILSEKVDILSHRTIREKLLCYFDMQRQKQNQNPFMIPFSYSSLANYLCVDRSAMMRELSNLRKDSSIQTDKRQIKLP